MRSLFVISFFLLITYTSSSQNLYREFGDINKGDFKTESNLNADAIVLFDKGEVIVEPGSVIGTTFKRHLRIKIITKNALSEANFEIFAEKGGFKKPKGITYNLENNVVVTTNLQEASVMETHYNKYFDKISISFTNVKEGSIIELSYVLRYENLFLPTWKFQNTMPVLWSQYTINAPIKEYTAHIRGSLKPTSYEEKYEGKWRSWTMINIPAFISEPLMPDKDAYISTVEFVAYTKTWEDVRNSIIRKEQFSGVVLKYNFLKKKVNELISGTSDSVQMIKIISEYLKKEIQFNETEDFMADDPSEVIERKSGSVGDINLLFASMLKKAGFNTNLILLSTRDNGFILESFPSQTQFNYVICHVKSGNKEYFLDATEKLLPFNVLPEKCYNHKGFLISLDKYGWIPLEPLQRYKVYIIANLALSEQGNLSGTLNVSRYDYAAFRARKDNTEKKQLEFSESLFGDLHKSLTETETLNASDIYKPFIENHKIIIDQYTEVTSDRMYIKPHLFFSSGYNPFTADKREYPIDFPELTDINVIVNLTIPETYQVDELPESKVFTLPENAARYSASIKSAENRITISSRLQINQELFQPYDYHNLKEFYTRMIAKKSELITLRKK